jgi:hypothetical protein
MTFARDQKEHYKKVSKCLQVSRKLASLGRHGIEVGFNNESVPLNGLPAKLEGHLRARIAATLARVNKLLDTLLKTEFPQAELPGAHEVATLVSHLQILQNEFGSVEGFGIEINLDELET